MWPVVGVLPFSFFFEVGVDGLWQALGLNREGSDLKVSQLVVWRQLKAIYR